MEVERPPQLQKKRERIHMGYSKEEINNLLRQPEKTVLAVLGLDNKVMQQLEILDYLKIELTVPNLSFVEQGDVLGEVIFTIRENSERHPYSREVCHTNKVKILAPSGGILYIEEELGFYDYEKNGTVSWDCNNPVLYEKELQRIALIFFPGEELLFYYFKTDKAILEKDPYTNLHKILWEHDDRGIYSDFGIIKLDYIDDKAVLVYQIAQEDEEDKLIKGDCISLRFQNGHIIDYLIQNEPTKLYPLNNVKDYYWYLYCFTLYKEDLILLLDDALNYYHSSACFAMEDSDWDEKVELLTALESYRITYRNNRLPAKTVPISSLSLLDYRDADVEIQIYTRCYLDALNRLVPDYKFPLRSVTQSPKECIFDWCYVYLMKDTSNGYYKIGISNTPEYRERTLQSEKPSIEMIACKKFPTRKIAESIESALHTSYSQQRLRGEWFNLNDADVAAIIETLK